MAAELPSIFRVYLLNKTSISVELHPRITVRDVCMQIKKRLAVTNDADYGLFDWSAEARIYLSDDALMSTALARWPPEALLPGGGRVRKLVYRRRLYLSSSALEQEKDDCKSVSDKGIGALTLAYDECFHHVMTGCYPCDIEKAIKLAALAFHRDFGNKDPDKHVKGSIRPIFPQYLPEYLLAQSSPASLESTEASVLLEYGKLTGNSQVDDMKLYIQSVKLANPWYGASFYHSQCALYDEVMRYVRIGVGYTGIYLFVIKDGMLTTELYRYDEITKWSVLDEGARFAFWLDEEHAIALATSAAHDIDLVIQSYVHQNVVDEYLKSQESYTGVRPRNRDLPNNGDPQTISHEMSSPKPRRAPGSSRYAGDSVGAPPVALPRTHDSVDSLRVNTGVLESVPTAVRVPAGATAPTAITDENDPRHQARRPSPKAGFDPASLPPGWAVHTHAESGQTYFFHRKSGKTRWDPPTPSKASEASVSDGSGGSGSGTASGGGGTGAGEGISLGNSSASSSSRDAAASGLASGAAGAGSGTSVPRRSSGGGFGVGEQVEVTLDDVTLASTLEVGPSTAAAGSGSSGRQKPLLALPQARVESLVTKPQPTSPAAASSTAAAVSALRRVAHSASPGAARQFNSFRHVTSASSASPEVRAVERVRRQFAELSTVGEGEPSDPGDARVAAHDGSRASKTTALRRSSSSTTDLVAPPPPRSSRADSPAYVSVADPDAPLPDGWKSKTDPSTGDIYYYNKSLRMSSWTRPTGSPTSPAEKSPKLATDSAAVPLPSGWRRLFDAESGRPYYYEKATGSTSWDFPSTSLGSFRRSSSETLLEPSVAAAAGAMDHGSSIPVEPFTSADELASSKQWVYRDDTGEVQGPFARESMRAWCTAGYFDADTLVRPVGIIAGKSLSFYRLGHVFGDVSKAFTEEQ